VQLSEDRLRDVRLHFDRVDVDSKGEIAVTDLPPTLAAVRFGHYPLGPLSLNFIFVSLLLLCLIGMSSAVADCDALCCARHGQWCPWCGVSLFVFE
jgi:hypothetical protein